MDRETLTVVLIADRAGVTPSTIYRRWGGLQNLLADLAAEHLRPESEPADTGDGRTDLQVWVEQYADEMSSVPGRAMVRDVLCAHHQASAVQCCAYTTQQIAVLADRAHQRGQAFPTVGAVMDGVVAPVLYAILFQQVPDAARISALIDRTFTG